MDRMIGGVHVSSDGGRADVGVGLLPLAGAATVAGSFFVGGWIRLGMQVLGGFLLLPLVASLLLMIFGGAVNALAKPTPAILDRLALLAIALLLGVWLGASAPGAPHELIVTPLGLFASGWLLWDGIGSASARRRRGAVAIAVAALSAGATGLWLLH